MGEQNDDFNRGRSEIDDIENKDNFIEKKKSFLQILFNSSFVSEILRLMIYLVIFILFYYFFLDKSSTKLPPQAISNYDNENQQILATSPVGTEVMLDEILVNTADDLENHFIKMKVIISCGGEETLIEVNRRLSEIYDRIRKIVGNKKYNELRFVDGQEILSLEIKAEVQKITGKVDIYNIFFKEFTAY